ncbi:tRNA pseudouridine(55) synthase TruB [Streptococcus agalactiae]|nr:tRNA pseudouridine(55) synthase TruB [Streptococcus agalactiae]
MITGIINLKKEAGMTSHDAVFKLRKILHTKKIGHGGTLDPDVVGVLPIAVGKATRVIEYMTESGKIYEGEITLGYATSTEDSSGEVISRTPLTQSDLSEDVVDHAMKSFIGPITQVPPMYSAVKVNGKKLYEYARSGEEVERPKRQITISEFRRTSPLYFEKGICRFSFYVSCSKGTYVRTLAVDLGIKLGYASHMSFLKRTSSAGLSITQSLTLEEINEKYKQEDFSFLLPIEYGVLDLPKVNLTEEDKVEISYGRRILLENEADTLTAFYENRVIAILEKRGNEFKPHKVLL